MLVVGMDGLDPTLLRRMMDEGRLPNFARVAAKGTFNSLGTSMPPQSPVAWSNFISGSDPGKHQIYDFVHRKPDVPDPQVIDLYLSTSDIRPVRRWYSSFVPDRVPLPGTAWQLPLEGDQLVSLRRGPSFWDDLIRAGIDTTIYRVPANYPPPPVQRPLWKRLVTPFGGAPLRCLCGMGTPDVNGGYGEFTVLREDMLDDEEFVPGGRFVRLDVRQHHASASLEGPPSPFIRPEFTKADRKRGITRAVVDVVRDPTDDVATIQIDQTRVLLRAGEWSGWVPLELRPDLKGEGFVASVGGPTRVPAMARLYLRSVHPNLELYVSPLNIDPQNPAQPISTPSDFAAEISELAGRYYTQGIPEDTKALRSDAMTEDDFLEMVRLLATERTKQYRQALAQFDRGFLFFYFGHTDQLSHIFWRDIDPGHPGRKPEQEGKYVDVIEKVYEEMDERVGEALAALHDDDLLLICSDHGFSSFRRGVNVNRWLAGEGFLAELSAEQTAENSAQHLLLPYVDWSRTRAYAVGINSIYLNLRGREKKGIVDPKDAPALLREISEKLVALRDADAGDAQVVVRTYITAQEYPGADPAIAPDLLVGYSQNYRGSWATVEGRTRRA
ncbi:MAG: alkaline phosphatase family protein, partial [Planctomycetes bacterium]|nr:alkaline phosphatase family protein [Planctomycetota bacterium]